VARTELLCACRFLFSFSLPLLLPLSEANPPRNTLLTLAIAFATTTIIITRPSLTIRLTRSKQDRRWR